MEFTVYCSVESAFLTKIKWALGAYERWRTFREQIFAAHYTASNTRNNRVIQPIHEVAATIPDLKHDVCDFIVEIRKENSDQYPSGSLYDLLQGLSLYLEREKGFEHKLISGVFHSIRNTLDNMMKECSAEGIKTRLEHEPILEEHEECPVLKSLWAHWHSASKRPSLGCSRKGSRMILVPCVSLVIQCPVTLVTPLVIGQL